jgi:DNA-binding transcriptional MocR family regulator
MSYWDNFRPGGDGPTYIAIFKAMAQAIERGDLQPGRRLPSHRLLAEKLGVAVGTVTRAYNEALDHGLIRGQIGRGSFVREHHPAMHLSVVDQSRIPAGTIDLYQNFPVAFPEVENRLWSEALGTLRRHNDLATMMRASWSEESAQRQHAGSMWIERTGLKPAPHNVFDCPGVQSALCAILGAVTQPGDLVAAPSLSHPGIKLLADQYSLKIRGLPMDENHLDPEAFETICRETPPKVLYCSPTIHPPTAITMPEQRRRAIAEIAERYDVIIVEDESAAFLLTDPPLPIAAFAPERSFFVGDVWMALSLSLRTTFVLTPDAYMDATATAVAATSGVTSPLVAEIASLWIESDAADRLIELRRAELMARNDLVRKILGCREVRNDPCGHHIWLELPRPWTSENFVLRAEKRGVAINGAEWFAIGHGPVPEAVRVCIGNAPDQRVLHWALETLDGLIDEPKSSSRPVF